ncbi:MULTISPECIES: hypothetical protein [Streptomyces]|uniref:hypothetical protein n=1 Tax=Streptomyces TaxID=1883 RepID=UPI001E533146|nr:MULTISPECIES: hypothetical protein [Streptomyces]
MTAFVVRRFVGRGLLAGLSTAPDGTLHRLGHVDQVCRREDLAELVAADTPLGQEQVTARLGVRRVESDWMVRLGWVRSPQSIEVRFGTSRAGTVDLARYRSADGDAIPAAHPEADWEQLRDGERPAHPARGAGEAGYPCLPPFALLRCDADPSRRSPLPTH